MLHDGSPRTRVRSRLLTAGTAGAAASMLQRFVRGKIHDDCRTKSRGARTKPSSLASSAITDRTSVSHLSVPSCLLDAAGGGASSTPSRGSLCPPLPPPPPREDDPTSSGPPKRRRSLLVGRHSGPGGIRYHFVADSPDDLTEARAEASLRRRPVIIVRAQDPSSGEAPDDDDDDEEALAFSHPLVVEAIECLFVAVVASDPVCVGDPPEGNEGGPSSRAKSTAVRIVWDQSGGTKKDLWIPFSKLSVGKVATAMVDSLREFGGSDVIVPRYLRLLAEEECDGRASNRRTAMFGSQCSRSAEIELSRLDGVVATRAGRVDPRRVVSVAYDAGKISYGELVRFALKNGSACVDAVFYRTADERIGAQIELQRAALPQHPPTARAALPRHPAAVELVPFPEPTPIRRDEMSSKAALRSTCLMCVPLTDLQSTRANALVDAGRFHEAVRLLSPRQGRMLMTSVQRRDKFRETIDVPIRNAWKRVAESGVMD